MCLMMSRSIMRSPFMCRTSCVCADFGRSSRSVEWGGSRSDFWVSSRGLRPPAGKGVRSRRRLAEGRKNPELAAAAELLAHTPRPQEL